MNHFNGTWGCGSWSGKKVNTWNKVTCKECDNRRHNYEQSVKTFEAGYLLNGCSLKKLRDGVEKLDPTSKDFRKANWSPKLKTLWKQLNAVSIKTAKLETVKKRFEYIGTLPKTSEVRYLVECVAHAWFSKHLKK